MKLWNLPLFKRVYPWHALPKENLSPCDLPEKNTKLFSEAYYFLNFMLVIAFLLTIIGIAIAGCFNIDNGFYIVIGVGSLVIATLYLKRKRLIDMNNEYFNWVLKRDCF